VIAESSLSKPLVHYQNGGTGTATVRRAHHVIALLIIADHDVTPISDQTMERYQSTTINPPPVRQTSLSDRDWDKCGLPISVGAWCAASMNSGSSSRDGGGVKASARDSADQGVSHRSDLLRDQRQAIRRRLWILNATLESLPAKIELACGQSGVLAGMHGPDQPQHAGDEPGDLLPVLRAEVTLGGWRARWKLARLRSRADRAERRATVAIQNASASCGAALEAVLHAAIARGKADEACRRPGCAPAPRGCDHGDDRKIIDLLERNSS